MMAMIMVYIYDDYINGDEDDYGVCLVKVLVINLQYIYIYDYVNGDEDEYGVCLVKMFVITLQYITIIGRVTFKTEKM